MADTVTQRPSGLEDACKLSHEVSVDSQRLSKLASVFEDSLRVSRDAEKSSRESKKQIEPCDAAAKSHSVSIMEHCVAAMAQTSRHECEGQEDLETRHLNDDDDYSDDDDTCSSLLASLTDLQTQLQHEIRQTQQRLRTTKRGIEETSLNSRSCFEQAATTHNHASTTTTTIRAATTTAATTTSFTATTTTASPATTAAAANTVGAMATTTTSAATTAGAPTTTTASARLGATVTG